MPSLGQSFDPKKNAIGFMRLVAASSVIFGHAITMGGYNQDVVQVITNNQLASGRWPVDVFFVLSGFLLTASFQRTSLADFARNRALRIYPAFLVCITITGLLVPPLFGLPPYFRYIWRSAPLLLGTQGPIPGLFTHNVDQIVNGALWTLPIELWCYITIPIAAAVGLLNKRRILFVFAALVAGFIWIIATSPETGHAPISSPLRLASFFYAGVTAWLYRDDIPVSGFLATACAVLLLVVTALGRVIFHHPGGLFYVVAPLAFSYLVLFCAVRLPFTRINTRTDVSYGIYIYGTLVIQILAGFGLAAGGLPYFVNFALVAALTLGAAFLSWHFIEKPAMNLKRRSIHPVDNAETTTVPITAQTRSR